MEFERLIKCRSWRHSDALFARAHFVYTLMIMKSMIYNGELCAHLMLHNPIFVICARGSFVRCFIITVIISTKQRGFGKNVEIHIWFENEIYSFWKKESFLIYYVWYENKQFQFCTDWHENSKFAIACIANYLSMWKEIEN